MPKKAESDTLPGGKKKVKNLELVQNTLFIHPTLTIAAAAMFNHLLVYQQEVANILISTSQRKGRKVVTTIAGLKGFGMHSPRESPWQFFF